MLHQNTHFCLCVPLILVRTHTRATLRPPALVSLAVSNILTQTLRANHFQSQNYLNNNNASSFLILWLHLMFCLVAQQWLSWGHTARWVPRFCPWFSLGQSLQQSAVGDIQHGWLAQKVYEGTQLQFEYGGSQTVWTHHWTKCKHVLPTFNKKEGKIQEISSDNDRKKRDIYCVYKKEWEQWGRKSANKVSLDHRNGEEINGATSVIQQPIQRWSHWRPQENFYDTLRQIIKSMVTHQGQLCSVWPLVCKLS